MLPEQHWLKELLIQKVYDIINRYTKIKDIKGDSSGIQDENTRVLLIPASNMSEGTVTMVSQNETGHLLSIY